MADDRTRATGVALLALGCACAAGCEAPSSRRGAPREPPVAVSRSIDFLQPSADRERLFFLTDIDRKRESATLDVVTADGVFTPLAALVYQAAFGEGDGRGAPSAWWDERPLHPREDAPTYQVTADGLHALALLQRYGRRASVLALFDAGSGAMTTVATDVEGHGFRLDASGRGAFFLAGADALFHVASPGEGRTEIAPLLSPAGLSQSPSGQLLTFFEGCASRDPPRCRLAVARADGSAAQGLSANAGQRLRDLVFDGREERVLFPEDIQYVPGLWGLLPSVLVSASVADGRPVRLAPEVQAGAYRFSPDGRWVALLARPHENGPPPLAGTLQLVPATGGAARTVAEEAAAEIHFSPDGKRLYFLGEPHGASATLEVAAVPDGEPTALADRATGLRESPDGRQLLYLAGFRAGSGTLRLLTLADGQAVTLGEGATLGSYRFSADGRHVYWARSPSRASASDSALRGGLPYGASDGAELYGASAPHWAPVLLATGLFEQQYYPSPDGQAVLSFPRVGSTSAAVLSFLDGTRVTLASGVPGLWSMPDEPAFSPSGQRVAFFASGHGDAYAGQGAGKLEVAQVGDGRIIAEQEDVRTFVWLARDRLYAVGRTRGGREESLAAVPLSP